MRLIIATCFMAGVVVADPVRTEGLGKPAILADAEIRKAEKKGTVSTQAQIDALLAQGKTKEALAAFFKRDATIKDAKAKAEKLASKGKVK